MHPDPTKLLEIATIETSLTGFYDVPDPAPFEPLAKPQRCFFSCYENWQKGEWTCLSEQDHACRGSGYWVCGQEFTTREGFVEFLCGKEGLKASPEVMDRWLENHPPYRIQNGYVVIGPLKERQEKYLKTVTFWVNPDQLSLLLMGAQYLNPSVTSSPVSAPFGSGCSQLAPLFGELDSEQPRAVIGATDIAMRAYLPPDILALTVNPPMFRQLCELDEKSFLYKPFWKGLRKARGI